MKPVAVITGGTRGIGYAIAEQLKDDHDLVIMGRDEQRLEAAAEALGARTSHVDLADHASIAPAAQALGLERLDVLVHSAGVFEAGRLAESTDEDFTRSFAINVTAIASLTRAFLPALDAAKGRVVMINSGSGRRGSATTPVYTATKFALNGLAESLRLDLGPRGIRVSTVAPGRTDTDMQRQLVASEGAQYQAERYLTPHEVASAVAHVIRQGGDIDYLSIRPPEYR